MLSSSGSTSPAGARTPTFDKPLELSPPGSQTASHHEGFVSSGGFGAVPSSVGPSFSSTFEKLAGDRGTAGDGKSSTTLGNQVKEAPGASWNNPRAQEEYNRAMESVVDRDFSLRKF